MDKIRFVDYLKEYLDFKNITHKDFANRIGISQKHLIDILSGKCDLSMNLIDSISIVTSIPSDYIFRMELNYKFEEEIDNYLKAQKLTLAQFINKFSYKYLIQNDWIAFTDKNNKMDIAKDILRFLRVNNPERLYQIDSKIYYKSNNNKPELLLLWLEKCYRETLKQEVGIYNKENIEKLVVFIKSLALKNVFSEKLLIEEFNKMGIALVIQEDIPGSKIRGAFKVHKDVPAIYITYKHKRIADIYFTLLHELAHCKRDFNKAMSTNIVSFEDEKGEDIIDLQAFEWMVDNKYYNDVVKNPNYRIENETNFPKSFIVYRLAKDKTIAYSSSIYQKYNQLLVINK